ncbi:uncharacterized protein ACNLHF_000915 [Anomaloglossus baeobatrachus]|uniref:uncharacterized protein LOC142250707 n=1 Tax=Anomaloglossus baeobatrachus TaxID=238106 RepID=UPI003F4F66AE
MLLLPVSLLLLLCGEGRGRRLIPHVTAPETWRLAVLERVLVRTSQQSESFPVTVSIMSYPDKRTMFSSVLLALTPDNRFRGAVELAVMAEDSPGEFVYLVVESEVFREDQRIPVTGAAHTTMEDPDISAPWRRRQRRQSLLTAPQMQHLTQRFRNPNILRCCLNGTEYYTQHDNCNSEHSEALKRTKPRCQQAYEECCNYAEWHMRKDLPIASFWPGISALPTPYIVSEEVHVPVISGLVDDTIRITVTQSGIGRTITSTFTVRIDPTQDISVQLSSADFQSNINVSHGTLTPADGNQ